MTEFDDDQTCFVCGPRNPSGLRLAFRLDGEAGAAAEVVFPSGFQGWRDTVHGGLLATVLDEVMVQAARLRGTHCVTAELTVKYRKPARTGAALALSGRILQERGRILLAEGEVRDPEGQLLAEATGKLFRIP